MERTNNMNMQKQKTMSPVKKRKSPKKTLRQEGKVNLRSKL